MAFFPLVIAVQMTYAYKLVEVATLADTIEARPRVILPRIKFPGFRTWEWVIWSIYTIQKYRQ